MKHYILAALYGAGDAYTEPFVIYSIGAIWFLWASFWGSIILRFLVDCKKEVRLICIFGIFFLSLWTRRFFWFPLSIQAGGAALLFMYFGFLLRKAEQNLRQMNMEVKVIGTLIAFFVWLEFIRDFQSFWLVHADIGRGMVDIVGSLCGCWILVLLAIFIDRYVKGLSGFLAFSGRNSLYFLCIHIIELHLFPWDCYTARFGKYGLAVKITGKLLWIYLGILIILGLKHLLQSGTRKRSV